MKKLILLLVGISFVFACSAKEQATDLPNTQANCTISGHSCWEVIQLLEQTQIIQTKDTTEHPQEPWTHYIYTYENPVLQNWGIAVTQYDMYKDGGSTIHILNDGTSVYTNRRLGSPRAEMGAVTVTFKDGAQYRYNKKGKAIK